MKNSVSNSVSKVYHNNYALCGLCILIFVLIVALFYMRKNTNTQETFTDRNDIVPVKGECMVALFYTNWCPHCQHFKPHFKKAMTELEGKMSNKGKTIRLTMVDCEVNKELGKQYEVSGYPTVKILMDDGTQEEYTGDRNYEGLRAYLL